MINDIEQLIHNSAENIQKSTTLSSDIQKSIESIIQCIKHGNKIVLFGNGGSAADAQHIAAEFVGRFNLERKSIAAIALTTDTSIITSIGNDYSFNMIFSRQCESIISKDDVVIGISTSGNSLNVINGLKTSKKNGAKTIGLLGNNGGKIKSIVDNHIIIKSKSTARIQEVHRIVSHLICDLVEKEWRRITND